MTQNLLRALALALVAVVQLSLRPAPNGKSRVQSVVLDPGHGGHDPGTNGLASKEKAVALSIALNVEKLLKANAPDLQVDMTRRDDRFIELDERAAIANRQKASLFVSIHCNANKNRTVFGTETYAMGLHKTDDQLEVAMTENASINLEKNAAIAYDGFDPKSPEAYILFSLTQNAYLRQSLSLANRIEHNFKNAAKRHSRGVKQAGFLVLWKTTMPAVLVETGFLSNRVEEKFMASAEGQKHIANAIYRGISEYRGTSEQ